MTTEEQIMRKIAALIMEVHQLRTEVARLTKQLATPTITNIVQRTN